MTGPKAASLARKTTTAARLAEGAERGQEGVEDHWVVIRGIATS